jgi:hypothetical protein
MYPPSVFGSLKECHWQAEEIDARLNRPGFSRNETALRAVFAFAAASVLP